MRYALISDIHGNLEALEAVLRALSKERIDGYLCVGDVVGYGADPALCIRRVKSLEPKALVAGNHDWGVLGLVGLGYFNEYAREAVIWTKRVLSPDELGYLKSLRLIEEGKRFLLVHGSLEEPAEFNYILNSNDAGPTLKLLEKPVCFVGHSHVAGIYSLVNGKIEYINSPKAMLDYGERYVVNVGSIGQPRDRDPRASYAIYDEEAGMVEIKRTAYDIRAAAEKILTAGLPKQLAARLYEGR